MIKVWNELLPFLTTVPFEEEPTDEFRYSFNNTNYSWGDGSVLHAIFVDMPRAS